MIHVTSRSVTSGTGISAHFCSWRMWFRTSVMAFSRKPIRACSASCRWSRWAASPSILPHLPRSGESTDPPGGAGSLDVPWRWQSLAVAPCGDWSWLLPDSPSLNHHLCREQNTGQSFSCPCLLSKCYGSNFATSRCLPPSPFPFFPFAESAFPFGFRVSPDTFPFLPPSPFFPFPLPLLSNDANFPLTQ